MPSDSLSEESASETAETGQTAIPNDDLEPDWTSQGNQRLWIKVIRDLINTMDDVTSKHPCPKVEASMDRMYCAAAERASRILRSDMVG